MVDYKYEHYDLSDDDITKSHIRHMIGGTSVSVMHERIYEVNFPERPGALADFLHIVGDDWNISLFHYKNMASDIGSVLIGFEAADKEKLEQKLAASGLIFNPVNKNKGISLFAT
jgi:threonine dehydratase